MAHNFGENMLLDMFKELIDEKYLLSKLSLAELLSVDGTFTGKYFEGKTNHPNQAGHVKIAKLFLEKLKNHV